MKKLILASVSPRRREILNGAGINFSVHPADIDESVDEGIAAFEAVQIVSSRKAEAVAAELSGKAEGDLYILAADTVVESYGEILGKPKDKKDAERMLTLLAGCGSAVHTGYCIIRLSDGAKISGVETTYVTFDEMSPEETEDYISTNEPYDKAGAFAIQGRAALYIPGITGDYFNVMGLPLHAVYAAIRDNFGFSMTAFE